MKPAVRNRSILIIDDDDEYRELLTLFLRLEGMQAVSAANGVDALGIITASPPNLIITEWMLPMMDGGRFLKWLREEMKLKAPVLVVSASRSPDMEARALEAGADAVLFKPVPPAELVERIKKL